MPRFVIFASNDAHYSLRKMAAFLGLGENNVVLVPTDETGSMNTHHLKNLIEKFTNEGFSFNIIFTQKMDIAV